MRRFDAVIQYTLPSKDVALDVLRNRLALLKTPKVRWAAVQKATEGLSHAELARANVLVSAPWRPRGGLLALWTLHSGRRDRVVGPTLD